MSYYTMNGEEARQAAAGLGFAMRPYGRRRLAGGDPVACADDTFLYKFEKLKDAAGVETGQCAKKIKPAPIILGVVGLVGIGWLLLRKKR